MGEEVFQLHVATPIYKNRQETGSTGFLSLLELNRVFFPTGALQISFFKILQWQLNKIATGHKTQIG